MDAAAHDGSEFSRPGAAGGTEHRFITCSQEELIELELEALSQGSEQAIIDGIAALHEVIHVLEAATRACDLALAERYFALDEAKFRDVFTLAWCAGYRARSRASQPQMSMQPCPEQN
jgi:hypothetical protein